MAGYIFRCTNETEDECFKRNLFGEVDGYSALLRKIQIGDSLFLFNVKSGRFHGEFEATSACQKNLEPLAWDGKFPWQVRTRKKNLFLPIDRSKVHELGYKYHNPYVDEVLLTKLRKTFGEFDKLPISEQDFRKKFPADIRADDGHFVRSAGELAIDNWLFHNRICHGYERRLPLEQTKYCDFYLSLGKEEYVYVEYWGREDVEYQNRKADKIRIYKAKDWPLIELVPTDLDNLDEIMTQKLLKYITQPKLF